MKCKYHKGGEFPTKHGSRTVAPHKGDGEMRHVDVCGFEYDECPECGWSANVKQTGSEEFETVVFIHHAPYKQYGRDAWNVIANGEETPLADRRLLHLLDISGAYGRQECTVKREFVPALTDEQQAAVLIEERAACFAPNQHKRAVHAHL